MKYKILLLVACVALACVSHAQKANDNTKPYPYGNPIIKHMYTADAAPHVMPDGRVWMVTSVDSEKGGGYSTMHCYHTFSSADMVNWVDHGEVLNVWDVLGSKEEPEGEDWALWAPDMVYYKGKYYLYFPVRIVHKENGYEEGKRKVTSYIAVAVSNSPDQKFKVINPKIQGTRGIDPAVFIDDDGEKYLYYGSHWGAKLADNMKELASDPVNMDVDDKNFMEAIWMNKHDGKYYVSYHAHYGKPVDPNNPDDPERMKSLLDYGISDNPLGPFKHMGTLNYELGVNVNDGPKYPGRNYVPWRLTQSNHGGIVEYHGKEYLFYHTSALSSWRQDEFKAEGNWTQRSVCVDEIKYNPDGTIVPVQQTVSGVEKVTIDQPFEIVLYEGKKELNENKPIKYEKIDLGTGYYYFGLKASQVTKPVKVEIRLDAPNGQLIGTLIIKGNGDCETMLRNANGVHDVYLTVNDNFKEKVVFNAPRFFAGSPKKVKQ
ncbi:family 43 glycosylhydrolase [Draconibacterium sp.]|uniref:family 43 glycosylhydrolase n=1 Tax=Draconibacterium sp. TaxID=1965318 RepID=UPI0035663481